MKKIIIKVIVVIIILISLICVFWKISKSRNFQFFGGIVNRVETYEKVVALTFDDGPTEKTGEVLAILDELDVKATFFVTGNELEENMEEGKMIVEAGHELGNHSYSHDRMVLKSYSFIKEEVDRTDELIREAGYEGDIQFRPPYFKRLLFLPYYLNKNDRQTILCDVEPETYLPMDASPEEIVEYTLDNTKEGSIILMHVMYESRVNSLEAIEGVVEGLRADGYEFVTVSELLGLE